MSQAAVTDEYFVEDILEEIFSNVSDEEKKEQEENDVDEKQKSVFEVLSGA